MVLGAELKTVLQRMGDDNRLGPSHISLYLAILQYAEENRLESSIPVYRTELMPRAKILARKTFEKNVWELHLYGYIRYVPSYSSCLRSLIVIL